MRGGDEHHGGPVRRGGRGSRARTLHADTRLGRVFLRVCALHAARAESPVPSLPGNNVAYKRSALAPLPADAREGFQEVFVQAEWRRAGLATSATDALVVQNVNSWPLGQVTSIPFHHGRAFAARRFQAKGALVRVAISVLTLGLPALHIFRLFGETISRGRLVGRMVLALPWVVVFTTSWSIGEAMGCVFGAGTSASRWR